MAYIWKTPFKRVFTLGQRSVKCVEQYAAILPRDGRILNFGSKKSVALCLGIDKQYDPNYAKKSLGKPVENDAKAMGKAFSTYMGLNSQAVQVKTASEQYESCTKKGLGIYLKNTLGKLKRVEFSYFILVGTAVYWRISNNVNLFQQILLEKMT